MEKGVAGHRLGQRLIAPAGNETGCNQPECHHCADGQADDEEGVDKSRKPGATEGPGNLLRQITPGCNSILAELDDLARSRGFRLIGVLTNSPR